MKKSSIEFQRALSLHQQGRLREAKSIYAKILSHQPRNTDALHLSGMLEQQLGHCELAIALISKAIGIDSAQPAFFVSRGNALFQLTRFAAAAESYGEAICVNPAFAEAYSNRGNTLHELRRYEAAIVSCDRAIRLNQDYAEAWYNRANALRELNRTTTAVESYDEALSINPQYVEALVNRGNVLLRMRQYVVAVASYDRVIAIKPDFAETYSNRGIALQKLNQLDDAATSYRSAVVLRPDFADAYNNLANVIREFGEYEDAVANHRRALRIRSDFVEAHGSLIFTLDMSPQVEYAAMHEERRRWDAAHAAPLATTHRPHRNRPDSERRLRIGYVSADFREHSAAYAFGAMLTQFDSGQFEVFAYSNSAVEDALTRRFQMGVSGWRKIVDQSDEAVAELIRQDEIDILVDLSGHSAGNRLLVFARKPAPIQVTAWGYATGTGLKAMDAFFTDAVVVPPEERQLFTEEVRYLPCSSVLSFYPQAFPQVTPLPALSGQGITFGSMNRLAKVSAEAIESWSQVLLATPGSRMLMKAPEIDDAGVRARVTQSFGRSGVDPARLVLLGRTSWIEHVGAFGQVDIALDPFPHGGGVTALEGLMMGVPAVTLRWPTLVGRVSASILTTMGMTDWIAETPEEYVSLARQKTQDLKALEDLRQQLRLRFNASIIGDATAYVSAVEQEYRKLWRERCALSGGCN